METCAFCDAGAPLAPFEVPGIPTYLACAPCREDLVAQGRRPGAPFEPHLEAAPAYAWRMPLEPDATWLVERVLSTGALPLPAPTTWTAASMPALLDELRTRLGLSGPPPAKRPPGREVAYALGAAVVAGEELGAWDRLERIAPSEPLGELLFGLHAHHAARVRLARLQRELPPPTWAEPEQRQAAGDLALRAPRLAAAAIRLDPVLGKMLDAARQAYQYSDALTQPPAKRAQEGGLGHRVALLLAALSIERGDGDDLKARDEGSLDRAERLLKEIAGATPAIAPDPRGALLEAAIQRLRGSKDGCDRALARGVPLAGAEPRALHLLQHARYVRALESASWTTATDALRACRALRPDDRRSLLELAYLYYRRSMPGVAREVLEATLRAPPDEQALGREVGDWLGAARDEVARYGGDDAAGRVLLAACVARLGDPRAALDLLRPSLDEEQPGPAEAWQLAGLCEHELGRTEPALACLTEAVKRAALTPRAAAVRRDLVRVVLGELRERLVALEGRVRPLRDELAELEKASRVPDPAERDALQARLTQEVLGDPERDALVAGDETLQGLVQILASHGAALVDELDQVGATWGTREVPITLTSTDLLGMVLAHELADADLRAQLARLPIFSDLVSVGFGFSRYDRVTGSGSMMNAFLAYRALVARRIPEAVRTGRLVGEAPLPLELLLRFLAVVRSSDEARRGALALVLGALLPRLERRGLIVRA